MNTFRILVQLEVEVHDDTYEGAVYQASGIEDRLNTDSHFKVFAIHKVGPVAHLHPDKKIWYPVESNDEVQQAKGAQPS